MCICLVPLVIIRTHSLASSCTAKNLGALGANANGANTVFQVAISLFTPKSIPDLTTPRLVHLIYGTTTTPRLLACPTTLLAMPSKLNPDSLVSLCLIFAISYTCFKLIVPTVPKTALPTVGLLVLVLPFCPSWLFVGPGTFPAPRTLLLVGATPAAERSRVAVGGVRREKWKERSGRTVMRAGIGVPGL